MKKSIYLCGFMGCGKTHVGKLLAKKLDLSFIDLDEYIVSKEKRSIPMIFEQDGESYFRKLESEALVFLNSGYVVATGGGALISKENAACAKENGIPVFIDTDFSLCYKRIRHDTNRPLVQKNTREQLESLFNTRREIYKRHSVYAVNGNDKDSSIVEQISQFIRNQGDI